MLVHFPVARWSLGTACDVITVAGIPRAWPEAALFLTIGLITALPAALAGFMDFNGASGKIGTGRQGSYKADGNDLAPLLRSKGWALASSAEWGPVTLSVPGLLVRAAGCYYGGELVYRFGAGVGEKASK
jgi:uncharacterized membrane protein